MGQGKTGWWIVGMCAVIVLISIGYGLGRRAGAHSADPASGLGPAGAPAAAIQIEPIQPQAEMAAITVSPAAEGQATSASAPAPAALSANIPTVEGSARVREIQQALKNAGFDPGTIDGRMGAKTQVAVRDFQRANSLEADGKVGPRTWAKLETYLKQGASSKN